MQVLEILEDSDSRTLILNATSFKEFSELAYYAEVSTYIHLHNISFKIVPLGSDTLLITFIKLLEAFLEFIFLYISLSHCPPLL
jgi:hypothetical protein